MFCKGVSRCVISDAKEQQTGSVTVKMDLVREGAAVGLSTRQAELLLAGKFSFQTSFVVTLGLLSLQGHTRPPRAHRLACGPFRHPPKAVI